MTEKNKPKIYNKDYNKAYILEKRDLKYEKNNIEYNEQYPEGGIKCIHYNKCGNVLPKWWYECKTTYLCTECDMKLFFAFN